MTTPSPSSEDAQKVGTGLDRPDRDPYLLAGIGGVVGLAFLAFVIFAWAQCQSILDQIRSPSEWEYLSQSHPELSRTGGLTERGLEKWELVAVEPGQDRTYHFKRPKHRDNPETARVLVPTSRWSGRLPADQAGKPVPRVKGPKSWAALWKSLNQPGEPPAVDFSKQVILAASSDGNSVEIVPVLYRNGQLKTTFQLVFRAADAPPEDGVFTIIAIPREGVKFIDGQPLGSVDPEG